LDYKHRIDKFNSMKKCKKVSALPKEEFSLARNTKRHIAAVERLKEGVHIYNLGTGKGTSVLQLLKAFEEANGIKVPYEIVGRRPGDIAECYGDVSKAERELGWKAEKGIYE
jgi:UDP-glucose 4-epimerase